MTGQVSLGVWMRAARTARRGSVPRPEPPVVWAALAALAAGAVLCVLGWYGVSGERFAERQLPYLASCTVPGAALIIAGAVLYAHGRSASAAARVEELYGLLVAADPADPATAYGPPEPTSDDLRMVPGGTLRHRADCPLVAAKAEAVPARGELSPCPVCAPPPLEAGSPPPGREH